MSHITELNVEITINNDNLDYVLHHVETIVTEHEPTNKDLSEMIRKEYTFVKDLLGFKPYCVKIDSGRVGTTFFFNN